MANQFNVCDQPSKVGTSLARAKSTAQFTINSASDLDVTGMTITFAVPADRDVWVFARLPAVLDTTASSIITVKLTDGAGVAKDTNFARSGTASRNAVTLSLDEVIPAGSGTVTRKLVANSGSATGFLNNSAVGAMTLDAFVR